MLGTYPVYACVKFIDYPDLEDKFSILSGHYTTEYAIYVL